MRDLVVGAFPRYKKIKKTVAFLRSAGRKRLRMQVEGARAVGTNSARLRRLHPLTKLEGQVVHRIPASLPVRVELTRQVGAPRKTTIIRSTTIHAISASDVVVEPHSEILFQAGRFLRQPLTLRHQRENLFSASRLIIWNWQNFCLAPRREVKPAVEIPSGILVTGQGCTNWYHWLINILPKAFIAEQIMALPINIPFLVPKSIQGTRLEEALRLVSSRLRDVVFLEDQPYLVREAIVIESPTRENYRAENVVTPVNWSELGDFHFDLMGQYRNHMISKAMEQSGKDKKVRPDRIFFVRDNLTRPYNQKEVEAVLGGLGFTTVDLPSLPVSEQIMIMASCKQAVGPTGAQWAGWLFSTGATGLILIPKFLKSSSVFSKLGVLGQSELLELGMTSNQVHWSQYYSTKENTHIDPQKLESLIPELDRKRSLL